MYYTMLYIPRLEANKAVYVVVVHFRNVRCQLRSKKKRMTHKKKSEVRGERGYPAAVVECLLLFKKKICNNSSVVEERRWSAASGR